MYIKSHSIPISPHGGRDRLRGGERTEPSAAGLWRSMDAGDDLALLKAGKATSVVLDTYSGTKDANGNPVGNAQIIYAAFGKTRRQRRRLDEHQFRPDVHPDDRRPGDPELQDADSALPKAVPINNDAASPNGTNGRIILAKPALVPATNPNALLENKLYEGWLYALVVNTNDTLNGLYVTKDFGANWTKVALTTRWPWAPTRGRADEQSHRRGRQHRREHDGPCRQPGERRPGADGRPVEPEYRLHRRNGPGQPDPGQHHDAARPVLVRPRHLQHQTKAAAPTRTGPPRPAPPRR